MDRVLAKKNPENLFLECNSKTNVKVGYKSWDLGRIYKEILFTLTKM